MHTAHSVWSFQLRDQFECLAKVGPAERASQAAGGADLEDGNSLDPADLTVELSTHPTPSQEDAKQELSPADLHDSKCNSVWWESIAVTVPQCRLDSQLPLHKPGSWVGYLISWSHRSIL